jgi:hypothetical protein
MSIPHRDPNFTMADLHEVGKRFLEAANAYWEAAHKAGIQGAVIWLTAEDGGMAIYTRREYRERLLVNIDRLGPATAFGAVKEE